MTFIFPSYPLKRQLETTIGSVIKDFGKVVVMKVPR